MNTIQLKSGKTFKVKKVFYGIVIIFIVMYALNAISENTYTNFMADKHNIIEFRDINKKTFYSLEYGYFEHRSISENDYIIFKKYHTILTNNKDKQLEYKHLKIAGLNFDFTNEEKNREEFDYTN